MDRRVLAGKRRLAGLVGAGLAATVTELLSAAALDGYAEGCAKYDVGAGWDRRAFGLVVWTVTAHALGRHVEELDDERVRLLRPDGSVVLRVDGHPSVVEIGFWRQDAEGQLEAAPFGGSATKDRFAAGPEQLSLAEVRQLPELRGVVRLAAGHDGTPTAGLTAITIGQPQSGGSVPWLWRELLWTPPGSGHGDPGGLPPEGGPTPDDGPEVAVSLKRPAVAEPAS